MIRLLNEIEIKDLINDSLYSKGLISEEVYEKCGKPKYIQSLPGNLRSTDENELRDRLVALDDLFNEQVDEVKELTKKEEEITSSIKSLKEDIDNNIRIFRL